MHCKICGVCPRPMRTAVCTHTSAGSYACWRLLCRNLERVLSLVVWSWLLGGGEEHVREKNSLHGNKCLISVLSKK